MKIGFKYSDKRYRISRTLHWTTFIVLGISAWYAYPHGFLVSKVNMTAHIDWSWIATVVVACRIAWRLYSHVYSHGPKGTDQAPPLVKAFKVLADVLRVIPLLITATGVGVIWSLGRDVLAFGVPVATELAERSQDLQTAMEVAHIGLWYFFIALLALHVIMALER